MTSHVDEPYSFRETARVVPTAQLTCEMWRACLKITELRRKTSKELGSRFDVRWFHNPVLDDGAIPVDLLEKRILSWIAEEKGK